MRWMRPSLAVLPFTLLLMGCAVGYNSTLFVTKSNIGIDADTKPPTVEVSIARREGVLAPVFEGGRTLPVVASFRAASNPLGRFFFGVESSFAGGDAADGLSRGPGGDKISPGAVLCLSKQPVQQHFLWQDVTIAQKGEVRPFFFATDSTLGFKVAWSGMTAQFPDTLQLGFNRREFAWAPVFGTDQVPCKIPSTKQDTAKDGSYAVWMPAFLAVLENNVEVGSLPETGVKWLQFFATGDSATTLANNNEIRQVMLKRILPAVYQGTYDEGDPQVRCIQERLAAGEDQAQGKVRARELQSRWKDKEKLEGFGTILIKTKEFQKQRAAFITEKKIPCNR